ncbi:hypothetical protein [Salibacterium lacus]|uniref:Uncharacterized protein n=1 Tax=Salibacterium lacus TaxID=1898109 RepID=A0ABW5T3P5_9BACI
MYLPPLRPSLRSREFKLYDEASINQIVYEYLFYFKPHRQLDEDILNLSPLVSKGFQSAGVLHHLGLYNEHKGLFHQMPVNQALTVIDEQDSDWKTIRSRIE